MLRLECVGPCSGSAGSTDEARTIEVAHGSASAITTISGRPIERLYTPDERRGARLRAATSRDPGAVPVHARHSPDRLPRQAVDDAAVRRVRHARGDQRALQAAARGRRHRAERRLRSADADGPRSGSRAVARRGREVRRQRDVARRHGDAVRRHRSRRDHDVDDDQLAGGDDLRDVSGAWPSSRAPTGATLSGTIQNDILKEFIAQKEFIYPPRPSMRLVTDVFAFCADARAAVEHDLGERLSHPRGRRDGGAGAGVHAARRHRVRAVRASTPASTWTRSRRGSRSSSTRTATSSRRSRSIRAARRIWARVMRDRFEREGRRGRGSCASTRRRPACR